MSNASQEDIFLRKMQASKIIQDWKSSSQDENVLREARMTLYASEFAESREWVAFGEFSRTELNQQCQYGSRYLHGKIPGYPKLLDDDSKIKGDVNMFHSVLIHVDAIPLFLSKYREFR